MKRFAFYGRVSTEDRQDPKASKAWQFAKVQEIAAQAGGEIVMVYFDSGESRRKPWTRRPEASRLLADAKQLGRGWDAVVVSEAQRAFSGFQYEQVIPRLKHYGVEFWVPGIDGPVDLSNEGHAWQLVVMGRLSESERRVIQIRVKDGLRTKARDDGTHFLGGRPPYGYLLADAGPHPNPSKAKDGKRLRKLQADPVTAPAVPLIFDLHVEGRSLGEIAQALDDAGYPSPSTHDRERNPHRTPGPWNRSAVRAILTNENYTGFLVYGKQPASYELLDPEEPQEGTVKVQRRADPETLIRASEATHPALITREQFAASQARLVVRGARTTRLDRPATHPYVFRSRLSCAICGRRMEASRNNGQSHYRCRVKNAADLPQDHPRSIYVREDRAIAALDTYMTAALGAANRETLIADLLAAEEGAEQSGERATLLNDIASAERSLRRCQALLDAEEEPDLASLSRMMKEATARRTVAEHRLSGLTNQPSASEAEIRALFDKIPDLSVVLPSATLDERQILYRAMDLRLVHDVRLDTVSVSLDVSALAWGLQECPRGDSARSPIVIRGQFRLAA